TCNLLRVPKSAVTGPNMDQDRDQSARKRRGGQSDRQEPPPDPSFHWCSPSWLCLLLRLHEKHSLPALRAFGQVQQHPLLFPRGSCALDEHTELVSVGMYPGLEFLVHSCRSLLEFGSPFDSCSNLRRLISTSPGSVPSASSAARRLSPPARSVRSSSFRRCSVARFSLRLTVAS